MAMIQLFRSDTGEPMAVMDGRLITEMRTAAVSAVAVDCLARQEVKVLGILGSGVQARSHVKALARVRKFEEIRVWSRTEENARRFAEEVGARVTFGGGGGEGRGRGVDPDEFACTGFAGSMAEERCDRVCGRGGDSWTAELDDEAMQGAVVVESREAECGNRAIFCWQRREVSSRDWGAVEWGWMDRRDRPVVFKSVGIAIEDIAAAKLVYERLPGQKDEANL